MEVENKTIPGPKWRPILLLKSMEAENIFLTLRVTLKFDGWPWKTIRHLFYATSSSLHYFVAIGEFKLVLQSGNS